MFSKTLDSKTSILSFSIISHEFVRVASSLEFFHSLGYSDEQLEVVNITLDHSTETVVREYAIKKGSITADNDFDPNFELEQESIFYLYFAESSEQLIQLTTKINIPDVSDFGIAKILSGMLTKFSPKQDGYPNIISKLEEDYGKIQILYNSGRIPSLPVGASNNEKGNLEFRASPQRSDGQQNPLLLKSIHFSPNNIFGLPENITINDSVNLELPPKRNLLKGLAFGVFLKEGMERVLVTSQGIIADSIVCISMDGIIVKTWPAKLNMPAGRDKLTLFVDVLNNFEELGRIYNAVVNFRAFGEIS